MEAGDIDGTILELTAERGAAKTVCPSEVARRLAPGDWRPLMEPVRDRARVLARSGKIRVTQRGEWLDPDDVWVGPVRLGHIE